MRLLLSNFLNWDFVSMHLQHTCGSCTPTSASASILGFTLFHLVACGTCILETCVSLHSSLSFRGSFGNPSDKNHHYHIEPLNKLDASVRRYSYSCHAAGFEFFMFHMDTWSSFSTLHVHWHSIQTEHVVTFLSATYPGVVHGQSMQTKLYTYMLPWDSYRVATWKIESSACSGNCMHI